MLDTLGRNISYLRLSVTDKCNCRCTYCMPPAGVPTRSHRDLLSFEELTDIVRAAATLGVRKVRRPGAGGGGRGGGSRSRAAASWTSWACCPSCPASRRST